MRKGWGMVLSAEARSDLGQVVVHAEEFVTMLEPGSWCEANAWAAKVLRVAVEAELGYALPPGPADDEQGPYLDPAIEKAKW